MDVSNHTQQVDEIEETVRTWHPRSVLRRTNWLYRVDALRPNDVLYLNVLWETIELLRDYATHFMLMGAVLFVVKTRGVSESLRNRCSKLFPVVMYLSQALVSEGYCLLLDFMRVGYYPSTNRVTNSREGCRFPELQRSRVNRLSQNEARTMTGFSLDQLQELLIHLRIPGQVRDEVSERWYVGEEAFLHYLVYNRLGLTKLQLSLHYFGGDPRRFSYSIRAIGSYLYNTFYHKISGDSLRQWMPYIHEFRQCLWGKVTGGGTIETSPGQVNQSSQFVTICHH